MQTAPLNAFTFSWTEGYRVVALAGTYRGVDLLSASAALHADAGVGWTTAEAAVPPRPRPRQRQHCCHDNQLHPLPGAAQTPATRGGQVLHQILSTLAEQDHVGVKVL